jgi:hypothetical protein
MRYRLDTCAGRRATPHTHTAHDTGTLSSPSECETLGHSRPERAHFGHCTGAGRSATDTVSLKDVDLQLAFGRVERCAGTRTQHESDNESTRPRQWCPQSSSCRDYKMPHARQSVSRLCTPTTVWCSVPPEQIAASRYHSVGGGGVGAGAGSAAGVSEGTAPVAVVEFAGSVSTDTAAACPPAASLASKTCSHIRIVRRSLSVPPVASIGLVGCADTPRTTSLCPSSACRERVPGGRAGLDTLGGGMGF